MPFVPSKDQWIYDHFIWTAQHTISKIGSLKGKTLLDVGCGDMMTALGLADQGSIVTALDISNASHKKLENTYWRVRHAGYWPPLNYADLITPIQYNGEDFPLEDNSIDIVFCWGVMEHVMNVPRVLAEMRRVMKPDGICFIKVFPWFHTYYGAHIADWVTEPFAHLNRSEDWIQAKVDQYVKEHPDKKEMVERVWSERKQLNKYSANMFYQDVLAAGFSDHSWELMAYPVNLTNAPKDIPLSDLAICGSECILRK